MPSVAKKVAKIVLCTLLYLIAFDVTGVAACFFFEIAPLRGVSTALFYTIWLVLGIFCGLLSYNTGGRIASGPSKDDWSTRPDSGRAGLLVIAITLLLLAILSVVFYCLVWQRQPESSFFVPDNTAPTLTFFVAVLGAAVFAHASLRSEPKKAES